MKAKLRYLAIGAAVALAAFSWAWSDTVSQTTLPLEVRNSRQAESSLGDLVADAVRWQFTADIALVPAGLFRTDGAPIPAGDVTQDQLTKLLFFPDEPVVLVELPGSKIRAALERGLSFLSQPSVSFLQVSGLAATYQSAAPAGRRITQVMAGTAPLDLQHTYLVAMPESMAKGSMGYFRIFDGLQKRQTGPALSDVLFRYLQTHATITIRPGERLRALPRPSAQ